MLKSESITSYNKFDTLKTEYAVRVGPPLDVQKPMRYKHVYECMLTE